MVEPPTAARVAETVLTVRSYELDAFNHANHAVFLNYLEAARYDALRQGGFPYEEMMARGWGVYVVRLEIDYLKEARLGDRLRVLTWADEYRRSSVTLAQVIVRDEDPDQMLARARVTAVWVDPNKRPMRIPPEVRAALGGEPAATSSPVSAPSSESA